MRSFLFVPGDSERKLAKGPSSGPDGLILDLEDSVATDRKQVAQWIKEARIELQKGQQRPSRGDAGDAARVPRTPQEHVDVATRARSDPRARATGDASFDRDRDDGGS